MHQEGHRPARLGHAEHGEQVVVFCADGVLLGRVAVGFYQVHLQQEPFRSVNEMERLSLWAATRRGTTISQRAETNKR